MGYGSGPTAKELLSGSVPLSSVHSSHNIQDEKRRIQLTVRYFQNPICLSKWQALFPDFPL
jgi:hypothetical protein